MQYYSQFKQDQVLNEQIFKNKTDGFFVDIGAYDGITDSNSLFFESIGWKGICIEPNPIQFDVLKTKRKCEYYKYAISDKEETATFFQITDGPSTLSGLVNEFTENAIVRINDSLISDSKGFDYITVECKRFNQLVKNTNIDYLTIDTEGNEFKILNSIDFNKYNINVLTVENNNYDNTIINFMITKNYKFLGRLGCDEVYMKEI